MTTNRLAKSEANTDRPTPPQGKSPEQEAARQRFWIERGNAHLDSVGKSHLRWCCSGGENAHYWIEER